MRTIMRMHWVLLLFIGLNVLETQPVRALESVNYSPGSSFTLNPTTGNSNQGFGTVKVQSDGVNGWVLQVRSLSGGVLRDPISGYTIDYNLVVDGNNVDVSSGDDVTAKTTTSLTCSGEDGCTYSIRGVIAADAIKGKPAGAYRDTLTFTLTNQ